MSRLSLNNIVVNVKNLERILDNLKDGIVAHDFQRRIFYFNSEAERITGFSRKDVIGKDCHEALGGPLCGGRCSFCGDSVEIGETTHYRINIVTRGGENRAAEMTVSMMRDDHEQPFGVLAVFRDMTDLIELRRRAGEVVSFSNIIGRDVKMLDVFQQVRDVADYDFPVHVFGETGTGKELVAAAVHNESLRGGGPFVPINCGALPESLIESELFGHVKGSFSGAVRDKKGRFELAEGGTIFLDEVAELSLEMQVKLLRFLQDGTFQKVGGEKTLTANARIISATNKDLKKEVKAGRFREDLYYRLNVIPINLPPLRERKNDIPLLVDHFLDKCTLRHNRKSPDFSKEAMSLMVAYAWPGNVREVENAVQFSIVRCKGKHILPSDLPMELGVVREESIKRGPNRKLDESSVRESLIKTGGNKAKAARVLGVGRATLYRFLDDHPTLSQG